MAKNLVIVESPNKVKTIKKFLGKNYEVLASNGHIRDLPKSQLGVDPTNDFEPKYITIRGKGDLLAKLRKEAKKADTVYLATDPDREGEAISWHLTKALSLDDNKYARITFNEITKNAVKNSLKTPRKIDMDLVDSQQARRILDRVVGYEISPVLWTKVKRGLSAGRVQSVALKMICDREELIRDFIPEEYYTLDAVLKLGNKEYAFSYFGNDKKQTLASKDEVDAVISDIKGSQFVVSSVKKGNRQKKRPLPFTTSTMQQEASKALNFSIQKTMRIAQQLYEGIDIKGMGSVGLISYLRTDSTRISDEAKLAAKEYICNNYGNDYYEEPKGSEKKGKAIQDAHEAIRPSDVNLTPSLIKDSLSRDEYRLYQLIWKRFLAASMSNAVYETISVKAECNGHSFSVSSQRRVFDGFMSVYVDADEAEEDTLDGLDKIKENDKLALKEYNGKQHFTSPPAHFTEASLVHTMEELGIGRPSTYSPTIAILLKRHYVVKEGKNLFVSELGEVVNDIMEDSFTSIVDENFTANMEGRLDSVEEGNVDWKNILREFYPQLEESVKKAHKELEKVKIEDEVSDVICDSCGRNMVIKYGPFGKFLACPGFPECRNTKPYLEKIGVACPKCKKDVVLRKTKKGRKFYGCEDYPECDFSSWSKPVNSKCPLCGSFMVIKGKQKVCANEKCSHVEAMSAKDES